MLNKSTAFLTAFLFSAPYMNGAVAKEWSFVDTKSGASAVLSQDDDRFIAAETAFLARFCDKSERMMCFSTDMFAFAIPRDAGKKDSWTNGDRIYYIIQRFADAFEKKTNSNALLIYSRRGDKCEEGESFDQVSIYSKSAGLRLFRASFATGGVGEFWAVERKGFAAGWVD